MSFSGKTKGGWIMKKIVYVFLFIGILMVTSCAPLPPFELKPETPNLNIASSQTKPLKIAIVVQDPMPYTIFYQGQGKYRRDMTAESRTKGFLLERDLSKIVSETFAQAFKQVVVLRDLPQPGQYDAVVKLNVGQILLQERVVVSGETCDVTADWNMSVLDLQNREISSNKGISSKHNFKWSTTNPSRDFILGINSTMSLILSELAKEWGTAVYGMEMATAGR
jgi:hypothetical protein